jgi:hypothetical protein
MADFFARTKQLEEMVGKGTLKGEFAANRIYAAVQHERGWKNFMGTGTPKEIRQYHQGGGQKFVESVVAEKWQGWMMDIAAETLHRGPQSAVIDAMHDLDEGLKQRAPLEDGDLRNSGTYTVKDNGRVIADKPSEVPYRDSS